MRPILHAFALAFMLFSCSSEPSVVHLRTIKGQKKIMPKVEANQMLTIEIEGMACEMACGGSIRSNLKATGSVERVQFDFVEGRKIQTAFISFDDNKIDAKKIMQIIEQINDKQFKTHNYSSESMEKSSSSESLESSKEEASSVNVTQGTSFELPNLFDLFKFILK